MRMRVFLMINKGKFYVLCKIHRDHLSSIHNQRYAFRIVARFLVNMIISVTMILEVHRRSRIVIDRRSIDVNPY